MSLPTIHTIRDSLENVEGALVNQPWITTVDIGDAPCVPINQPETSGPTELVDPGFRDEKPTETSTDDEQSIIFEIPPDLDDRAIQNVLGKGGGSNFERLVEAKGTDALGWYFPFHYRIAQHGIYISSVGVIKLAIKCFWRKYSEDPIDDLVKRLQYSAHAILRHECFHFATECMAANWELATGRACYVIANQKLRSAAGYVEDEEALANAYMLRGFRWVSSVTLGARATPSLKAFCALQPTGYNRGPDFVATDSFELGCRRLASAYHECMDVSWIAPRQAFDSLGLYPNAHRIDWRRCPIIIVDEQGVFAKLGIAPKFINNVLVIKETQRFSAELTGLGPPYYGKWRKTKEKLAQGTQSRGLDFKPWRPKGKGWFSVRVDGNVRAHLRNDGHLWYAEEIGSHDAMGH